MARTMIERSVEGAVAGPAVEFNPRGGRLFAAIGILAIVVGLLSVLGGIGGAVYTHSQAAAENVTTPATRRCRRWRSVAR